MIRSRLVSCAAFLIFATSFVRGQQDVPPAYVSHLNQEVRVRDLSPQSALSTNNTAVLAAALETIFHDAEVCCGKNSALQDEVEAADPLSLKDVAAKLQGKHPSNAGRPITVNAEYLASDSIHPGQIISVLKANRALLVEWKSRLYVLYGAAFDERLYYNGQRDYVIHKLFLLDLRFSDSRRDFTFNRDNDDWGNVQGLLTLSLAGG
jgi:hypothetical protein